MKIIGNTFEEFISMTQGKKVIAFAASDFLQLICTNYRELKLDEKISYIVDNDKKKQGSTFNLRGKEKHIYEPEKIKKEKLCDTIILITSAVYSYEIYQQLEGMPEIEGMGCFILSLMIEKWHANNKMDRNIEEKFVLNEIPKKIHCFWFSKTEKTELALKCMESWKRVCPDYEIIEWNTDSYDVTKNEYMHQAYKEKNWAYVSDYARLDVLYQYGGIYFDLDVELLKRPDQFLKHDFFIGFGPIRDIEAAAFGARPGCEILLEMMNIYSRKKFNAKEGTNLLNVQPVYLDHFFEEKGFTINGEYQEKNGVAIYPREVFSPRDWFTGIDEIEEETVGIHHCVGGWISEKGKERKKKKIAGNRKLEELYFGI